MPRIMSRTSMRKRTSMGSMSSLSSAGKGRSSQNKRERTSDQERYPPCSSFTGDRALHVYLNPANQQQISTTNQYKKTDGMQRSSTNYFDSVESEGQLCISSPTLTASTMPMNSLPSASSSWSSYNLSSVGVPPPDTTSSLEGLSRNSSGTNYSSKLHISKEDSWGQFVDVTEAEKEIERHSQFMSMSSRERSHKIVGTRQYHTAFRRLTA